MYILFVIIAIITINFHPSVNWNIYILLIGGIVQVYHCYFFTFTYNYTFFKKGNNWGIKGIKKGRLEFSANPPDGT